jgi:hypothetical protein
MIAQIDTMSRTIRCRPEHDDYSWAGCFVLSADLGTATLFADESVGRPPNVLEWDAIRVALRDEGVMNVRLGKC